MKKFHAVTRLNIAVVTLALATFLALMGGSGTAAETTKPTALRLAYSAMSVNQAIPWISYEAGHFKKYGLDVELVHASSILALQALLAGEVAIVQSATDAAVSSNLNGADTLFMAAILDKPLYSFMVNAKIKTPEDLKGQRVGVTRFASKAWTELPRPKQPTRAVSSIQASLTNWIRKASSKRCTKSSTAKI